MPVRVQSNLLNCTYAVMDWLNLRDTSHYKVKNICQVQFFVLLMTLQTVKSSFLLAAAMCASGTASRYSRNCLTTTARLLWHCTSNTCKKCPFETSVGFSGSSEKLSERNLPPAPSCAGTCSFFFSVASLSTRTTHTRPILKQKQLSI